MLRETADSELASRRRPAKAPGHAARGRGHIDRRAGPQAPMAGQAFEISSVRDIATGLPKTPGTRPWSSPWAAADGKPPPVRRLASRASWSGTSGTGISVG